MTRQHLPIAVRQALIDVCGRSFWYKQPLFDLFARAGIAEDLYLRYEHEAKFKIGRQLIGDLEQLGDEGMVLQRRLLAELCKLSDLPDRELPDQASGLGALRTLRAMAQQHRLITDEILPAPERSYEEPGAELECERRRRLEALCRVFNSLAALDNRQARGYQLEDLVRELFAVHEIRYRNGYVADGEQIDGFFAFGGFDYIVEARWRQRAPNLAELAAIRTKVDRKIESTRGFVVSIPPFKDEVVRRLREAGPANLILMDGYDLLLILLGRISLIDALQAKVDKAAQEGILFYSLARLFG